MNTGLLSAVFLFGFAAALFVVVLRDWAINYLRVRRAKRIILHESDALASAHRAVLAGQASAALLEDPLATAHHACEVLRARLHADGALSAAKWAARAAARMHIVRSADSCPLPPQYLHEMSSLELAAMLLGALTDTAADLRATGQRRCAVYIELTIVCPIHWHVLDAIDFGALLDPSQPEYRVLNTMAAVTVTRSHRSHRLKE